MAETNPKDTKHVLLYLVGAVVILGVLGYLGSGKLPFGNQQVAPAGELATIEVQIKDTVVNAQVADTDEKRRVGLGKHDSLIGNSGMLFVFPNQDITPAFWMKDVEFAIDIIWINDGVIVQVDTAQPELDIADADLALYKPGQPVDYVLEMPAEFALENQIHIGDPVDLSNL